MQSEIVAEEIESAAATLDVDATDEAEDAAASRRRGRCRTRRSRARDCRPGADRCDRCRWTRRRRGGPDGQPAGPIPARSEPGRGARGLEREMAPVAEPEPEPVVAADRTRARRRRRDRARGGRGIRRARAEPVAEVEPEPGPVAPTPPPVDVVAQPTWQIVAPDAPQPTPSSRPVSPPTEPARGRRRASAEPEWPAQPEWPTRRPAAGGLPFLNRPAAASGGIEALWAESARESPPLPRVRRPRRPAASSRASAAGCHSPRTPGSAAVAGPARADPRPR